MRVIITAGGTGGHIYPAIAIINKIKKEEKNSDISTGCLSGFCFTCFRFMFFRSPKKSKQQGKYNGTTKDRRCCRTDGKRKKGTISFHKSGIYLLYKF